MKYALIFTFCTYSIFGYSQIEFNFGKNKDGNDWIEVNDEVMGGLSKGELQFTKKSIIFKGTISLKNNGGFASFRNQYDLYNLQYATAIEIKYRSKGQIMALSLEPNDRFYEPTYRILLEDTNRTWKTTEIDIKQFSECILGEPTGGKITDKVLTQIKRIGFINTEKKAGDFEIEIQYLKFK